MSESRVLRALEREVDKLNKRITELEAALIKYGAHNYCPGEKCTCGFDRVKEQALKGE